MADQAKLQDKLLQISLLKQQLAKLDPGIDEQAAKQLLLADQVTPEQFQTVWNGLCVRNVNTIIDRIAQLGGDAVKDWTPYAAFGQVFDDQVSDYEFREAFLAVQDSNRQAAKDRKVEIRDQKSKIRKKRATKPDVTPH